MCRNLESSKIFQFWIFLQKVEFEISLFWSHSKVSNSRHFFTLWFAHWSEGYTNVAFWVDQLGMVEVETLGLLCCQLESEILGISFIFQFCTEHCAWEDCDRYLFHHLQFLHFFSSSSLPTKNTKHLLNIIVLTMGSRWPFYFCCFINMQECRRNFPKQKFRGRGSQSRRKEEKIKWKGIGEGI